MDNNQFDENVAFRVDAGLIDRLGRELVGRAETAVSELIKNAYDADAREVSVTFIDSDMTGGTLFIEDDGCGMTYKQLIDGFMTISSTDKVHNPKSEKYKRQRAGRKGIGRFATQRLGEHLTIITQTNDSGNAFELEIDWKKYQIDQDITTITNSVRKIAKQKDEGTLLKISNLRDPWTVKSIERIYRYVSDLFQPDYLSDEGSILQLANQKDNTFQVRFYRNADGIRTVIADPQKMIFDKALAVIEGSVDSDGKGAFSVSSKNLSIEDFDNPIEYKKNEPNYPSLKRIHFKAYYFIYEREEYYAGVSKLELRNIRTLSEESSGIRLYRNGFRVLPYGEPNDDWLGLDIKIYSGEKGSTNIPYRNRNFFGFVEVLDIKGKFFEETASREGLLSNDAFRELQHFVSESLFSARLRLREGVTEIRKAGKAKESSNKQERTTVEELLNRIETFVNSGTLERKEEAQNAVRELREEVRLLIDELGMIRVLAALGLTIAEFTHEVTQYTPSINGYIAALQSLQQNAEGIGLLEELRRGFNNFIAYTAYFNTTISQNVSRELQPIRITDIVNRFVSAIKGDANKMGIEIKSEFYGGYDLFTVPMHPSEWTSILYNLYTNSKKAIQRANSKGIIAIIAGEEGDKIYIEFTDNGDGVAEEIKDRIFNAFFTTSLPAGFDAPSDERLVGTGLGLKIVKDIIETYGGKIFLIPPETEFVTCFRIEIPKASSKQLMEYGI